MEWGVGLVGGCVREEGVGGSGGVDICVMAMGEGLMSGFGKIEG